MKVTKKEIQKNRQDWIKALRSGEYKRTVGRLKSVNGFCCLGVACEILTKKYPEEFTQEEITGSFNTLLGYSFNREIYELPIKARTKLGLNEETVDVSPNNPILKAAKKGNWDNVMDVNDSGNFSFKKIADIIEWEFNNNSKYKLG